jgi:hypothetical protein
MNLTLDIQANDIGAKRVNVRSSLLVANLIATIQDKFNLDGSYELRPPGSRQALRLDSALDQAGVADGHTLTCVRVMESTGTLEAIARGVRAPLTKEFKRVYLSEARTLNEYDVAWQPALLGRKDHRNPANNRLLIADLEDIEELPTVSRHHACLTEANGSFFVESVQARNPTYLDGVRLRPGMKYPLPAGSIIQLGQVWLTFHLIT